MYFWWGDATEVQPDVDADYGRNDVWNGWTGGGTPITSWSILHLDEQPSNPSPAFKDSSGSSHDANATGTLVDSTPGRGVSGGTVIGTSAYSPGTGDFALIQVVAPSSAQRRPYVNGRAEYSSWFMWYLESTPTLNFPSFTNDIPMAISASRNGDNLTLSASTANRVITGVGGTSYSFTVNHYAVYDGSLVSFVGVLSCAPNIYWLRAFSDCVSGTSPWDTQYESTPIAVIAYLTIAPVAIGSEVRVYEEPHGQSWTADMDGVTLSFLNSQSVSFQVMGESGPEDHYVYFDYNFTGVDPELTGTGHVVAIAVGDDTLDAAATLTGVINGISGLSAELDGTLVTVLNTRNGELAEPSTNSVIALELIQIGGLSKAPIDGVEMCSSRSWIAQYSILRPRLATIVVSKREYVYVRIQGYRLTVSSASIPTGQQLDPNYYNPPNA